MFQMTGSWRTNLLGVCAMLTAAVGVVTAVFDDDALTNPDWLALIAAFTAGFGLLFARDNKVTSEQAGAK